MSTMALDKDDFEEFKRILFFKKYDVTVKNKTVWETSGYCGLAILRVVINNYLKDKGFEFSKLVKYVKEKFPDELAELIDRLYRARRLIEDPSDKTKVLATDETKVLLLLGCALRLYDDDIVVNLIHNDGWITNEFITLILYLFGFEVPGDEAHEFKAPSKLDAVIKFLATINPSDVIVLINKGGGNHWVLLERIEKKGDKNYYVYYDPEGYENYVEYDPLDNLYIYHFKKPFNIVNQVLQEKKDSEIRDNLRKLFATQLTDSYISSIFMAPPSKLHPPVPASPDKIENKKINFTLLGRLGIPVNITQLNASSAGIYGILFLQQDEQGNVIKALSVNIDKGLSERGYDTPFVIINNVNPSNSYEKIFKELIPVAPSLVEKQPNGSYRVCIIYDTDKEGFVDYHKMLTSPESRFFVIEKKGNLVTVKDDSNYKTHHLVLKGSLSKVNTSKIIDYSSIECSAPLLDLNEYTSNIMATSSTVVNVNLFYKYSLESPDVLRPSSQDFKPKQSFLNNLEILLNRFKLALTVEKDNVFVKGFLNVFKAVNEKVDSEPGFYADTNIPKLLEDILALLYKFLHNELINTYDIYAKLRDTINKFNKSYKPEKKKWVYFGERNAKNRKKIFLDKLKNKLSLPYKQWLDLHYLKKAKDDDVERFIQEDYADKVQNRLRKGLELFLEFQKLFGVNSSKQLSAKIRQLEIQPDYYETFFAFLPKDVLSKPGFMPGFKEENINKIIDDLMIMNELFERLGEELDYQDIKKDVKKNQEELDEIRNNFNNEADDDISLKEYDIYVPTEADKQDKLITGMQEKNAEIVKNQLVEIRQDLKSKGVNPEKEPEKIEYEYYYDDWYDDGGGDWDEVIPDYDFLDAIKSIMDFLKISDGFNVKEAYKKGPDYYIDKFKRIFEKGDFRDKSLLIEFLVLVLCFAEELLLSIKEKAKNKPIRLKKGGVLIINKSNKSESHGSSKYYSKEDLDNVKKVIDLFLRKIRGDEITVKELFEQIKNLYLGFNVFDLPYDDKYEWFIRWVIYRIWLLVNYKELPLFINSKDVSRDLLEEKIKFAEDEAIGAVNSLIKQ
ncbi:MAG: hypothetical protein JW791_05180 [Nanoarchaeota archaeon]|nr:hypothetical protein [Nanoarchaeota archaeon]